MKKLLNLLFLLTAAMSVYAQTREDILIYIAPVAGMPEHAAFFHDHFEMEVFAANYSITDNPRDADYIFQLEAKPNIIVYDDGSEEAAPPGEPQYVLQLDLIRVEDDVEIVSFAFFFTEREDIYEHSLTMVYQAMANVPITRLGHVDESDRWRNKWLYIRMSFDYPVVTTHQLLSSPTIAHSNDTDFLTLDHMVRAVPGLTVGLELQFLDWMSAEIGFICRFGDASGNYTFIPGAELQLKFPIKPARYFMLEPYVITQTKANTSQSYRSFPWLGVGAGFQFGIKGGESGAFFIDINFVYSVGDVVMKNPAGTDWYPRDIKYRRYSVGIGFGYKLGFFDRPAPSE